MEPRRRCLQGVPTARVAARKYVAKLPSPKIFRYTGLREASMRAGL
jgi:hypothetical protein